MTVFGFSSILGFYFPLPSLLLISQEELTDRTIPDLALCIQTPLHRGVAANPDPSTNSDSDEAVSSEYTLLDPHPWHGPTGESSPLIRVAKYQHPPSLPPSSGVRPEPASRYGPGDPVDPDNQERHV